MLLKNVNLEKVWFRNVVQVPLTSVVQKGQSEVLFRSQCCSEVSFRNVDGGNMDQKDRSEMLLRIVDEKCLGYMLFRSGSCASDSYPLRVVWKRIRFKTRGFFLETT